MNHGVEYRPEIDGLRALAVLPVVLFHAGFGPFRGGFVGVDVFLVISGYLITSIILAEHIAGTFTLLAFWERRARRILPALFVVIAACSVYAWFTLLPSDMRDFSDSVVATSVYLSNFLFWRNSGYFDTAAGLKPLLHTWSLAVEEQYYLLYPIFLSMTWRLGKRRIVAILCTTAVASLAAAELNVTSKPAATFYLLPTRGWELILGGLIAFYRLRKQRHFTRITSESGAVLGLFLIAIAVFTFSDRTPFPSVYALIPTLGAALIILCASPGTVVGKLLGTKPLVGIGLISYSAYLWHYPLFAFARLRTEAEPSDFLIGSLAVGAFVLAFWSWRYIETPFRKRGWVARREIVAYGVLASSLFIAFGVAGDVTTGFLFRYDIKDQYLVSPQRIEFGKYVERRFNDWRMKPFDAAAPGIKIVVIGDSFGQDLINALYENGCAPDIQLSTWNTDYVCGKLFVEHDAGKCSGETMFDDRRMVSVLSSSDEIWFAARWQPWQAERMAGTIAKVQSYFGKRVLVFGTKDFGKMNLHYLLTLTKEERQAHRIPIDMATVSTNELLKRTLPATTFVDIHALMCGADVNTCSLFDDRGELVSLDGMHLTRYGAAFLGNRLRDTKIMEPFCGPRTTSSLSVR